MVKEGRKRKVNGREGEDEGKVKMKGRRGREGKEGKGREGKG